MTSFNPPERLLMGPGPSNLDPRVSAALSRPIIGHLDPEFIDLMDDIRNLLKYAFKTSNQMTMAVSAPGSAGMECCFVNLVEPGDKVIVCQNGVFGGRMKENVERCGGIAVTVENDWGKPVDPNYLEDTLQAHSDAKIVAFVHAETSTGTRSDAEELARVAQINGCLTIVDTVTSLGGIPVCVDDWQLDVVYAGSQKCLSCTPGLSPVTFSERAMDVVKNRKTKVQSWFLDLNLVATYWGDGVGNRRAYHHTAPINSLYALHESLRLLKEESLEESWSRHMRNHLSLKAGIEALGLTFIADSKYRLPQLNLVAVPEGVDEARVRQFLLTDYNIEIGAGLGKFSGNGWRIGLMGHTSKSDNILVLLGALDNILKAMGAPVNSGVAVEAAKSKLYT